MYSSKLYENSWTYPSSRLSEYFFLREALSGFGIKDPINVLLGSRFTLEILVSRELEILSLNIASKPGENRQLHSLKDLWKKKQSQSFKRKHQTNNYYKPKGISFFY